MVESNSISLRKFGMSGGASLRATQEFPRPSTAAILASLAGLILSGDMKLSVGLVLTPGRIGILLFLLPALAVLFGGKRRFLLPDLLVAAAALWIVGDVSYVSGFGAAMGAPGGESLELLGGYLIARAYVFGPAARERYIRILATVSSVLIVFAVVEQGTGRLIVRDFYSALVGAPSAMSQAIHRNGLLRADATFEHPILFGTFCSLLFPVLLFWTRTGAKRVLFAGLCLAGVIASITSVALLGFLIAFGLYAYNHMLRRFAGRWKVLWTLVCIGVVAVYGATNDPLGWLITHLTYDPESGYFRFLIWQAAIPYVVAAPLTGYAYTPFNNAILDTTVDSVWLVTTLRYGFPAVVLLLLASISACLPIRKSLRDAVDPETAAMATAFSIVLVMFAVDGLTVHYWNFLWIFWGACMGIRTSLREEALNSAERSKLSSYARTNGELNERMRSRAMLIGST
jgi:hypothetical protein